jgi:uncharacterized protein (DUF1778 family)
MTEQEDKKSFIGAKFTEAERQLIMEAAAISGRKSMSNFVLKESIEAAKRIVSKRLMAPNKTIL